MLKTILTSLFSGSQSTPLAPVKAPVSIVFDFYFGFYPFFPLFTNKLDILNVQATVQPLLFVIGPDGENLVSLSAVIQIIRQHLDRKMIDLRHLAGIGEHKVTVRLEVDQSITR